MNMYDIHVNRPRYASPIHALKARISCALTILRTGVAPPRRTNLSDLPDHMVDDIGLDPDDPRLRVPPKWIWVDFMPRG